MITTLTSCQKKNSAPEVSATPDAVTATPETTVPSAVSASENRSDPSAAVDPSEAQSDTAITYSSSSQAATAPSAEEVLNRGSSDPNNIYDAGGFVNLKDVIPEAQIEIRYATSHNFVGDIINGYEEGICLMTKEAAAALMNANNALKEQGYTIKIYDAYRPQSAVDHFVSWSNDYNDQRMKSEFYPELDKSVLFSNGYIAAYSGHSHGSTVDLTLVDLSTGEEVDMGGTFDYFGTLSHPDYTGITSQQYENRMTLRSAMINNGFSPLSTEWWHFTLNNDPYPNTYFNFPVSASSLQ
jgi:D-alanyl-D-alanine dipeptidase